jgi:HlyD family secretion protein
VCGGRVEQAVVSNPMSEFQSPLRVWPITPVRAGVYMALAIAVVVAAGGFVRSDPDTGVAQSRTRDSVAVASRRDFVRSLRLNGTVEAVESTTVAAPRLSGPNSNSLVITRLIKGGTSVKPGDLLVEFDRQAQMQGALDRRAELNDLEQQIRRKEAEARAAKARDDSEIQQAVSALERAKLEMIKNEMLPKIQVEKNEQALEEADARLKQLRTTYDLKRRAAEADIEVLRIRRSKSENAMKQAETNASRMEVRSPISGLAVIKTTWKASNMSEIQEGEEVRPGVPIVDIVNPERMRVRARVNQADINELRAGQPVRVGLDAYADLSFGGKVAQISPLGVVSTLSPKVRQFIVLIDVDGSHPNLMPDLTASIDVELERVPGAIVVPRDSIRFDGSKAFVRVRTGSAFEDRAVTVGRVSAHEAVVTSGLDAGATVARNVNARSGS